MQLVDEAVGEHRPDQRSAAADVEVAGDLVLEPADRAGVVRSDDLRVPPRRGRQRRGDDVLGGVVEERRPWIVLHGPRRPRRLEHLVGRASEQDAPAALRDGADGLSHLGVEAVVERPRRRVDDAVEAHELVHVDRSHVSPPVDGADEFPARRPSLSGDELSRPAGVPARGVRVRRARRAPPRRAAGPLLSDARLARGLRGPRPGDLPARVAQARELRLRRALLVPGLAVPDRDERVPRRAAQQAAPGAAAAGGGGRRTRPRRPRLRPIFRGCSRIPTGCSSRSPRGGRARRGGRRAGDDRARLHRRDPAPAAAAAGGADPPRRARLVGEGHGVAARGERRRR